MGILNHQSFCVFVAQEFQKIALSSSRERRVGAAECAGDVMQYVGRDLSSIESLINQKSLSWEDASQSMTELALESASFLYAVGSEHVVWRRWSSLTGFGMFLQGKNQQSAQYAVIGGEWDFIKILPATPVKSKQISEQVIWMLVKGIRMDGLLKDTRDEEDDAWLQLAKSIPAEEHRQTEEALKEIANFWMAEGEEDWMNFHPRSYPDFETPICSAAAIARHHGFRPVSLTPEQNSFLEAGLATPEPPPMFPNIFSLPAFQTPTS